MRGSGFLSSSVNAASGECHGHSSWTSSANNDISIPVDAKVVKPSQKITFFNPKSLSSRAQGQFIKLARLTQSRDAFSSRFFLLLYNFYGILNVLYSTV